MAGTAASRLFLLALSDIRRFHAARGAES